MSRQACGSLPVDAFLRVPPMQCKDLCYRTVNGGVFLQHVNVAELVCEAWHLRAIVDAVQAGLGSRRSRSIDKQPCACRSQQNSKLMEHCNLYVQP